MIASAPTEREGRIAARIGVLRFLPLWLAAAAFVWVALRMALPYRLEVTVVDQFARPISGARVTVESRSNREQETDDAGACAFWIRRDEVNYSTAIRVELPDLRVRQHTSWSWRQMRRGNAERVVLTLGDTVAGTAYDSVTRKRLSGTRASATFVHSDGTEQAQSDGMGTANSYNPGMYMVNGAWYPQGAALHGEFSITRSGTRTDSATSVRLVVWAPGHAPRTLALEPARTARGHAVFDAGDVLLAPWAEATGRLTSRQNSGSNTSQTGLVSAVVWADAAEELRTLRSDPALQEVGRDGGASYAILRTTQDWSSTFSVTIPVPATRVVLVAIAYDRPPAVVEVSASALAKLRPGGELAGYDELELPAPNPMTLTFKTRAGGAVANAQFTFARVLSGSSVAVAISQSPTVSDERGRVTVPILEDGVTYRIGVRKQTGEAIGFESAVEPRAEIIVPDP